TPLGDPARPVTTILLRGVGRMDIAYWSGADPNAAGSQSGWNDQSNANETPKLIKLTIRFPPGDKRNWPSIVVAPASLGPEDQAAPGQAQAAGRRQATGASHRLPGTIHLHID